MTSKKELTGSRLIAAKNQALDDLYEHVGCNEGKFTFWDESDSNNFTDGTKNLAKAKLVQVHEIDQIRLDLLYDSAVWFGLHDELLPVGIDCETTGLSPYTNDFIGVGLAVPKDINAIAPRNWKKTSVEGLKQQSESFDCYFLVAPREEEDYAFYIHELGELLRDLNTEVCWYMHNAKFDMLWLYHKTEIMLSTIEDSMCMGYLLGEGYLGIDKLAPKYLGRFPTTLARMTGKDKKGLTREVLLAIDLQEFGNYCAEDCIEGILLAKCLYDRLERESTTDSDLVELYEEYDKYCIHALVWSEEYGVLIDWEKLSDVGQTLDAELLAIEQEVSIIMQRDIEESRAICKSAQELSKVLYEELQLPTNGIKKGVKGFYSTDKNALNTLRFLHSLPAAIFDHRTLAKLKGTYVDGLEKRQVRGVIHTTYENCRTDTGRLSSGDPNLQNIPNPSKSATGKLLRQSFVSRPQKVIVKADYSQFELRILAHFSGDPYLIECYKLGRDVHSIVTCLLFDYEYEKFNPKTNPQHAKERTLIKTINFGLIYGMEAVRLYLMAKAAGLDYTLEQCEAIIRRYWSRLPGVRDWMASNRLKAVRDGYTTTVWGRRRYFRFEHPYLKALRGTQIDLSYDNWLVLEKKGVTNDYRDQQTFRAVGNAPIQGSNADCIRRAMGEVCDYWYGTETYLLLNVHDEIVLETPVEDALETMQQLKSIMEDVALGLNVPIVAEPTSALNWGDC